MPRLLVCDLDGTLLGDSSSLAELLDALALEGAPALVFATGRQYASATELLETWKVAQGSFLIAGVGSEMYERRGDAWVSLPWPALDARWSAQRVRDVLQTVPELESQVAGSPVKVSYFATDAQAVSVHETLQAAGVDATVVHSHGDLLDVLPPGIHKGAAVRALADRCNARLSDVMTCGDTENDLAMLELPGPSVIVGNARAALRARAPHIENVYIARAPHAAGILEGLRRYGWLTSRGWSPRLLAP